MISAADRRCQTRVRAALGVTDGRLGVATTTRDLSTDGMFVRALPYRVGDRIAVEVRFPDVQVPLRVAGDVVRVEAGTGVALKLVHNSVPQRLHFRAAITRLALAKTVRNVTQGGTAGTSNTARPNDVLEYTITYTNTSSGTVSAIVVTDATPSYTTYLSSACTTPLPASLTACTVTSAPAVGGTGSVVWTLTGTLLSNGTGSVSYQVRVSP